MLLRMVPTHAIFFFAFYLIYGHPELSFFSRVIGQI